MPENIHNTPATLDQHLQYLKDPMSPQGKPYSTKQIESNTNNARRKWLYHKTEGGKLFDIDEVEAATAKGWVDTPFVHPNNPDHAAPKAAEPASAVLDVLRKEAKGMGIDVDMRWGEKRLQDEMTKAQAD